MNSTPANLNSWHAGNFRWLVDVLEDVVRKNRYLIMRMRAHTEDT